ncbi:MAG: discoidin domain-containing protein [Flavobacteriales bacterium]|nr:discoidin domain-containing protein [Flavobacteriales bacterium]
MKKTKLPQPIRVHSDIKKEIAEELNITTQTVRMALGYVRNSELSRRIRSVCKEKLVKEAKKILIFFIGTLFGLQSFSQIDGSSLVRLVNVPSENDLSAIINPLMGCIAYAEQENRVYHYDGTNWMSIEDNDNQNLALIGTILHIQGGNSVNLSIIQDGTGSDDQNLSLQNDYNNNEAIINIEGGNGLVFKTNGNLQLTKNTNTIPHELTFTTTAPPGDGDAWNVDNENTISSIKRTGNVGIGTNDPIGKLDVNQSDLKERIAFTPHTRIIHQSSYIAPHHAINVLEQNAYYWQPHTPSNQSFTIDLGLNSAVTPSSYKMTVGYTGGLASSPANWTLEGSNDNSQWTVLHTSNTPIGIEMSQTYQINTTQSFRYFKLNIISSYSPSVRIGALIIYRKAHDRFLVHESGKVGINTDMPIAELDVNGYVHLSGGNLLLSPGSRIGIGTAAAPVSALHVNGSIFSSGIATIQRFYTEGMGVHGYCGIGTTNPSQALHVMGNILASGTITPDYVFKEYYDKNDVNKDYDFKSLKEIEQFVKKNKHLPGVPSEKDIEEQGGIIVNRATEINLEKIEELYLHLIQMEKRLSLLEKKK